MIGNALGPGGPRRPCFGFRKVENTKNKNVTRSRAGIANVEGNMFNVDVLVG